MYLKLPAIMLVAVCLIAGLSGCVSEPARHTVSPSPSPTKAVRPHQALVVPPVQQGELARLVYLQPGDPQQVLIKVPASKHGYVVEFTCNAPDLDTRVGYSLNVDNSSGTFIAGGSTNCDGIEQTNTAIYAGQSFRSVLFTLTGDFLGNKAYAVLTPASS